MLSNIGCKNRPQVVIRLVHLAAATLVTLAACGDASSQPPAHYLSPSIQTSSVTTSSTIIAPRGITPSIPSEKILQASVDVPISIGRAKISPTTFELPARIVAVGIPGVAGVRQIGLFHAGGAIPGNPEFLVRTRPGRMLDPERVLITSSSNFGAPLADLTQASGSILSIDTKMKTPILIPPGFAIDGKQVATANGAVQLYSAQSPAFLNRVHNRRARTAPLAAVSGPRYISINNAFGRPWVANASRHFGTNSVLDPDGTPLDNAPSDAAGGVFAATLTNRIGGQYNIGDLAQDALGTAFLGPSPDATGFAVFAVVKSDGSVVQVHVQDGVDGLAPPSIVSPLAADAATHPGLIGMAFKWSPERVLYIADMARNRIAALHLSDDTRHFTLARVTHLIAPALRQPSDLAAAIPEVANSRLASHTTLAGRSDLYVVNRGDGSVLRLNQDGQVLARARIVVPGLGVVGADRLRGIAVSADAQRLWLTLQGELPAHAGQEGVLLEISAFDATGVYRHAPRNVPSVTTQTSLAGRGELAFKKSFTPAEGLGPLFNARSCVTCHNDPSPGGMNTREENFALRVGRIHPVSGRLELLDDSNSPVARRHLIREGGQRDALAAGIPRGANVTSMRMPPTLYDTALIERIPDEAILAHAVNKGDGIRGRPNHVTTARGTRRLGKYGWKADVAALDEMVANAYANELGITSPLAPGQLPTTEAVHLDDSGDLVDAVAAYLKALHPPESPAAP